MDYWKRHNLHVSIIALRMFHVVVIVISASLIDNIRGNVKPRSDFVVQVCRSPSRRGIARFVLRGRRLYRS